MLINEIEEYWNKSTPMSFANEQWTYEQKREFRYKLQDYMQRQFQFDQWRGKKVLEIGCGSGIDAVEFARNGAIVTPTDLTQNAVDLTNKLFVEVGIKPCALKVDACRLPFEDESYDCVYSFGVLHHVMDIDFALSEIRRVLKPNGKFMGMVYHYDSLLMAYSIVFNHMDELIGDCGAWTINQLISKYSERNLGCPYTRAFDVDVAGEIFSHYFMDVTVDVEYNVIDMPDRRKVKFKLLDYPEKNKLGWHLIVKGEK